MTSLPLTYVEAARHDVMDDQNLLPPQAAASSVGESAPSTTPQPNGAEVPTASAHRNVVDTQPPSLSESDTGVPSDRDCVEPRPLVDVESRTRKQRSPKRHKKRRLSAEEQDRDVKPAEDIDFVDSSTIATASSGIIHQKVPEDKEHSPKSGGPENEAHCVDSCETDQPPMTSQSSLGDWADDMEADDAQQTLISPPEPMADIEPGGLCHNTTEPAAVVDPVTTSENVALNVNDFPSLKPALTAEIPSRDSEIPTKNRPLEDTERNVDEDSSCETPVARRPKPSPEDLLEVEKGDGMTVDVAPTSAQGLTPPRTDSDAADSDFSRKCDPEPEVTAEITASSAQPIQCKPYEEVPGKEPADSEAQRRAEGGNTQASPPRQQNNTTDTTPEPNIDDSQATAVAPFSHRRRLRQTPGLAVTRHQAKVTPEKKDIKKKNIKYEVIRANTDEEKENGHSDL
ncbi:uncharacterized protein LOC126176288 [Schistocerca cancellata]|uniref:uncharacterized protein LOC126176288 n=1 Tax=Schistocerca cancellata TaxID=274614 RepID=UPI002119296E|nr:uncharacterized protein LOC126176288 [Schistocerca cancellata]